MAASAITRDAPVAFANNAPADTEVDLDVALPVNVIPDREGKYVVFVYNPSSVTALTIVPKDEEELDGALRDVPRAGITLAVPAGEVRSFLVEGWLTTDKAVLTFSNDTALGGTDGFSARVTVRKVRP